MQAPPGGKRSAIMNLSSRAGHLRSKDGRPLTKRRPPDLPARTRTASSAARPAVSAHNELRATRALTMAATVSGR